MERQSSTVERPAMNGTFRKGKPVFSPDFHRSQIVGREREREREREGVKSDGKKESSEGVGPLGNDGSRSSE